MFYIVEEIIRINRFRILRKALAVPDLDDLSVISSAWVRFERCNGTLSQLKFAQHECEERLNKQQVYNTYTRAGRTVQAADKTLAGKKRDLKRRITDPTEPKFGKISDADVAPKKVDRRPPVKSAASRNAKHDMGPPKAKREKMDLTVTTSVHEERGEIDTANDDVTVFLSNLSYK